MNTASIKRFLTKKWVIVIACVLLVAIVGGSVAAIVLCPRLTGESSGDVWYPTEVFDIEKDAVILEKNVGEEFKILNFTDIQVASFSEISKNSITYKTIMKTVEETKPNLITITGDTVWGAYTRQNLKRIAKIFDSFGIPWAPVYGNHDKEGNADLYYLADILTDTKHCLFRKGPQNIGGVGNYAVAIREDGKIVHTLVMMDSGSSFDYSEEDEDTYRHYVNNGYYFNLDEGADATVGHDYAFLQYGQIAWYKWIIKGIAAYNGVTTQETVSTAMFHIPLIQYVDAYFAWKDSGFDANIGCGRCQVSGTEDSGCGLFDSGMFAAIKELGSTKTVVVGHDHVNDFIINYEGVTLAYGVKTGDCCYWVDDGSINGGTVITVANDNSVSIRQHYVDYDAVK